LYLAKTDSSECFTVIQKFDVFNNIHYMR